MREANSLELSGLLRSCMYSGHPRSGGGAKMAQQNEQGRWRDARDPPRGPKRRRTRSCKLVPDLVGQRWNGPEIQIRRNLQRFVLAEGSHVGFLPRQIAGIAGFDLYLLGDGRAQCAQLGPEARQAFDVHVEIG